MSESSTINLKEWIHIDSIESLLNNFNQRLTSQEFKCAALQNLCQEFMTKSSFNSFSTHIESELDGMSGVLDTLDRRTTVQVDGGDMYCDEIIKRNSEKVLKLEDQFETLVTRESFDKELEQLADKFSKEIQELKEHSASNDLTDRIAVCTAYAIISRRFSMM